MNTSLFPTLIILATVLSVAFSGTCSPGTYSYQNHCLPCTPGHYCPDGINQFRCQSMTYQSDFGAATCQQCGYGTYSICPDTKQCSSCPPGYNCPYFYPWETYQPPTKCPAGTFNPGTNPNYYPTSCSQCGPNTYQTEKGSTNCLTCPNGFNCTNPALAPTPCQTGTYRNSQVTLCTTCARGYYAAHQKAAICLQCPAGYKCSDPSKCPIQCPAGKYSNAGSVTCTVCPNNSCTGNYAPVNAPCITSISETSAGICSETSTAVTPNIG
ncbi:unnamed protein product [Didymodactylos carnosus]|uniref:Tyrosine-protein kinase ephrin type A/B receptor-like domain-containing protein n=1 Tax=Didymodactylos carnosus TaxID=1234261 RepID=A0A816EV13_9BILA|nr:unnamed protein product [Didymodactylos carnosus]CAF1654306.1 unnamed protein product [Didymodactylos carnosus]CAF3923536.1 unnamed protein product [Didymodactylos carnosus]CAF4589060.1 unnamed protein product [Didymodactylos carnosus]